MKTPEQRHSLPSELDSLLQDHDASEVERLRQVWELAEPPVGEASPDEVLQRVWANLQNHLDAGRQPMRPARVDRPPIAKVRHMRRWIGIAASLTVAVAVGLAFWLTPVTHTALPGETAVVYLNDGSIVHLNSGSSLQRGRWWFGADRRVKLDGEAFFEVAHEDRPFIVETFNAEVRVLGTRFNVRAWPKDIASRTTVALESGRVALSGLDASSEPFILVPGQTGQVVAQEVQLSEPDTILVGNVLSWRSGNFFFSDEWLGSILDDIERRFDTDLQVRPVSLRSKRMKLSIEKPASAELIVNDICETLGLRYRETSNGFELFDPDL